MMDYHALNDRGALVRAFDNLTAARRYQRKMRAFGMKVTIRPAEPQSTRRAA